MRAARLYAEEAAKSAPAPAWAGQAVFDARCAGGDWNGALAQLDRNMKASLVDRATYQRQRAVLLTTRAQAAEVHDPASARALALEAVRLAPTLIPAAALAGRLIGELGDLRRAARIVEAAWKANPHPDLAETYAHLRPGDSARERLARVETLAQMTPGQIEGALAVARAAIDAQEFAVARAALAPLLSAPTQRGAMLMAELEETESGDLGRAREWMSRAVHARRDPAWTADGLISERWMPVSPVSGRLDAFQWRDPLAALGSGGALVEAEANKERLSQRFEPRLERPASTPAERKPEEAALVGEARVGEARIGVRKPVTTPPAVIPLVQVPDDPGPEPEPPRHAWRRLRGMFR
jgi:HemY protein